jgi:hypothetical protein
MYWAPEIRSTRRPLPTRRRRPSSIYRGVLVGGAAESVRCTPGLGRDHDDGQHDGHRRSRQESCDRRGSATCASGSAPQLAVRSAFEPQSVMLLRPVAVDAAAPHRLEGALHADGADVDVADDEADHQQGEPRVQALRDLHARVVRPVEGKHQAEPGQRQPEPTQRHAPEDDLLAGVELARRRVGTADEAAAALEPFPVEALEQVLPGPQRDHHQHAQHERHGERHVRPGAETCKLRVEAGAEPRPDESVAIEDDDPRRRQQKEAHRG